MERRIPDFKAEARQDQERIGAAGAARILEAGRRWAGQWGLRQTLEHGGAVVFPHIGLDRCGSHTAAAVHACLDASTATGGPILALGVLHAITAELDEARVRVAAGADPAREAAWGIQGPGIDGRNDWREEFSLLDFLFLLGIEIAQRKMAPPEIIVRYPYLAGGRPEMLPRIGELERLVSGGDAGATRRRRAVVVATADLFHHGIGYGDSAADAKSPDTGGLDLARACIEEGLALLEAGDHRGYNQHCVTAKSDARDVGQVLRHVLGPVSGRILDLTWADTSKSYGKPAPTWVAGALISLVRATGAEEHPPTNGAEAFA